MFPRNKHFRVGINSAVLHDLLGLVQLVLQLGDGLSLDSFANRAEFELQMQIGILLSLSCKRGI